MNANQILNWLGYEQGTATKSRIRAVWYAFPEDTNCIFVYPDSKAERAGLRSGNNYTMESAFKAIGCVTNC